jgi:hypothetical protein
MVFTSRTGTYEEIGPLIKKLEAIETSEREAAKDVFYLLTFCRLLDCITKKQYTQSLSIIPEIKKGLKDFGTLLTFVQKRTLCTNICLIYLKNKMYPKVLDEVQEVYALVGRGKEKQHRIEDVRVFEFISHYELGNTELLHYMIRNNQRFFKEQLMLFVQDTDKPKLAKQKLKAALLSLPCPDINAALKKELIIWLDGGNG